MKIVQNRKFFCSFQIFGRQLELQLVLILIRRLPNLTALKICDADEKLDLSQENVLELFSMSKNLTDIMIHITHSHRAKKDLSLDLDFFRRFTETVKDRSNAKFTFDQFKKTIVTKNEITIDGVLVHWTGFEPDSTSEDSTTILDLTDECFHKICSFVDDRTHRALYETCTRTRTAVREKISSWCFKIDINDFEVAQDIIRRFGDDIQRLLVISPTSGKENAKKIFWNDLVAKCGKKLIELHIQQACFTFGYCLFFPNLAKLVLEDYRCANFNILDQFNCPKLTHFEMYEYHITCPFKSNVKLSESNMFGNLTTIKLDRVDECMENVFNCMNEATCNRITEFMVGAYDDRIKSTSLMHMMLINVISKFRYLTTLHLIVAYMENSNIKHLFEHCTKLVKLSVAFESDFHFVNAKRMFEHVRQNCAQIKAIQLIRRAFADDSDGDGDKFVNENQFDESFLKMVFNFFPKAIISIVYIDFDCNCIKEERVTNTWTKMIKRPL